VPHEKSENEKAGNKFYPIKKERPGKYVMKQVTERKFTIKCMSECFDHYREDRAPYKCGKKQVTPFSFAAFCLPFINIFLFAG
jgi:hypothetical protein